MCNSLPPYLEDELNSEFRIEQLNSAKMLLYLLAELHKSFDEVVSDHNKKTMAVDAKVFPYQSVFTANFSILSDC